MVAQDQHTKSLLLREPYLSAKAFEPVPCCAAASVSKLGVGLDCPAANLYVAYGGHVADIAEGLSHNKPRQQISSEQIPLGSSFQFTP